MAQKHTRASYLASLPPEFHALYDYSRVEYKSNKDKIEVVCRKHGTSFLVTANNHQRNKSGCPTCKGENQSNRNRRDDAHFAARFRAVHGDRYTYDWSSLVQSDIPMSIKCQVHGTFFQSPNAHGSGKGCPLCANSNRKQKLRLGAERIRARLRDAHPTMDVVAVPDVTAGLVVYTCPTHGLVSQRANDLINGPHKCAMCSRTQSSQEQVIAAFVRSFGVEVLQRHRPTWMSGKELDLFIPEHNLAIEYGGSHVHNSTMNVYGADPKDKWYHYDKWKICRDNGVTLLTIYDFDWFANREKWEAVIKHKIQKADRRVYARKCTVVPVERAAARDFCKQHHIEGVGGMWKLTTECMGLEHDGELVAVMACEEGDIKRSCTLSGTAVIGGVSRLFKSFPAGTTMMTTNNTGSSGNYGTLVEKKTLRYWWVKLSGNSPLAIPRRQCQKHLLEAKFGEPLNGRTERQYMEDMGFVKCYDSGLSYWVNK